MEVWPAELMLTLSPCGLARRDPSWNENGSDWREDPVAVDEHLRNALDVVNVKDAVAGVATIFESNAGKVPG